MTDGLLSGVAAVSALDDELRSRIYLFVRRAGRAVTREEVGGALGISVKLAAFHLDKLARRGLLRTHYARPPGRSGPGAGRSAKHYQPSDLEFDVSIPPRHYDLAGSLLVEAVETQTPGEAGPNAARRVARSRGMELGQEVRRELGRGRVGPERAMTVAEQVLERRGYEPYRPSDREIRMRNCPFHRLATQATDLVCGMNHAFIDGFIRGLGNTSVQVALEPSRGECCVTIREPKKAGERAPRDTSG